ncbi:GNAT family N-acetyltransferase [Gillisia marina]|uniref:GNAT family N-acetyltransferase n=1 Tax=Gillisia marina TaxID=1167637 RepID=UPI00029A3C19|nr:N-acetyltransferase [Gillisia marina]
MKIKIRQEVKKDRSAVFDLIEKAFRNEKYSDHKEQYLVTRLRDSSAFTPELSLVAEAEKEILGHILLTKIKIINKDKAFDSLALAPVSVLPDFQDKGIGSKLITEAHAIARQLGYNSIIVVGHKNYYPKFGYKMLKLFGISVPFEVHEENAMGIELVKKGLYGVDGIVRYPSEFYE